MFVRVQPVLARQAHHALRIAVAEAVDLGQRTGVSDEGVVGRHAAVAADAQDLAQVRVQALRVGAFEVAIAHADHQRAVVEQRHPAAEVLAVRLGRARGEDRRHLAQPCAIEPGAHHAQVVG